MRNVKIGGAEVYLPNTSTLGYDRYTCMPGDLITFQHDGNGSTLYGRVIGKITSSDTVEGHRGTGMLCVLQLSANLDHAFERWIKPEEVLTCRRPKDGPPPEFLAFFFGEEFMRTPPDVLRKWPSTGASLPGKPQEDPALCLRTGSYQPDYTLMPKGLRAQEVDRLKEIQGTWAPDLLEELRGDLDEEEGLIKLSACTSVGGYPLVYHAAHAHEEGQYCAKCAQEIEGLAGCFVHYEGAPITCGGCDQEIESAYGDPDEEEPTA